MGAGQETTAFTTLPFFAHMGMIYVTIGGKHKGLFLINLKIRMKKFLNISDFLEGLGDISQVHGGSAWGAGTITGADGLRLPSELELEIAQFQG